MKALCRAMVIVLLLCVVVPVFAGGKNEYATPSTSKNGGPNSGSEPSSQARALPKTEGSSMTISSAAFKNNQAIPVEYSSRGQDVSPALRFEGVPAGAKSLALIVEDPDAPAGLWVHWVVYNIPASRDGFDRAVSRTERLPDGTLQGQGSNGRIGYAGPCPPSGTHRYFFRLYALDSLLTLRPGATREQLLSAMKGHVLAEASLMGTFSK